MSEAARLALHKLRTDFQFYSPRCLKILTKDQKIIPFTLNRAQQFIHEKLQAQLSAKGRIRAIILKGRQQGASTYVGGRFYWRASGSLGAKVQILTHEQSATDNLFVMTKRYHDHCPTAVRPHTGADSAKELFFDKLDTRYAVATAGAKATGRSGTVQFFHGSEVAFWPNAEDHMAGIGQTVPDLPGTEIILESTANGIGNLFYSMVQDAIRGRGDYELIFVPWFWEDGYRRKVDRRSFTLDEDEQRYAETHGLDLEQMAWRRNKIETDFRGDEALFNQEYPATVEMAFMAAASDSLIPIPQVTEAQKRVMEESFGPIVIGCDPAEYGNDDTAIVVRQGRKVLRLNRHSKRGPMEIAGLLSILMREFKPAAVCVDTTGGFGTGICDRLVELGYNNVHRVHFGSRAEEATLYANRRAEIWALMRDWFREGGTCIPADLALATDLTALRYHYDSARRLVLESKEAAKRRGVKSPDSADALALTFAVRVAATALPMSFEPEMDDGPLRGFRGQGYGLAGSFEPA